MQIYYVPHMKHSLLVLIVECIGILFLEEIVSGSKEKWKKRTKWEKRKERRNSRQFHCGQTRRQRNRKGVRMVGAGTHHGTHRALWSFCVQNRIDHWTGLGLASKTSVPCLVILPKANHKITLLRFFFNLSPWSCCTSIPLMKMRLSII